MVSERKGTWFLSPTRHPLKLLTSKLLHYCIPPFIMTEELLNQIYQAERECSDYGVGK